MTEDSIEPSQGPNPFGPSAAASVAEEVGMVSVSTAATDGSLRVLSRYLESVASPLVRGGNVLALIGDYGAGKTHAALLLRNRVEIENRRRSEGDLPPVTCVYLEATASFRDLYYRFVEALTEAEVHDQVRRLYIRIVTERLGHSHRAEPARDLLDDPDLDPLQVTGGLGLAEPELLEELQQQLTEITRNRDMAVALSLLLRPGFRDRAWNWLRGGKPPPALRERGITDPLQTEQSTVDAFAGLASLYGALRCPLVVIADELDRLFARCAAPKSEAGQLLPRFLQSFVTAGALLVLAALDESFDVISIAAKERIGGLIRIPPFDLAQTEQFITRCLAQVQLTGLGPFTAEAVAEIVALTDGNPRRIRRYCKHLYDQATAPITPVQVRQAARDLFGINKRIELTHAVTRALNDAGWNYDPDYFVSTTPTARVDFWLPVGTESGCALLVSEAIVDHSDTARVIERLAAVREPRSGHGTVLPLLIVVEALAAPQRPALVEAFGREPVVYHRHSFADDLIATVKTMRQRLERIEGGDTSAVLQDRVEKMSHQQDRLQDTVDQVLLTIRAQRTDTDTVAQDLRDTLVELRRAAEAIANRPTTDALPDRVRTLFEDRLGALAELGDAVDVVEDVFRAKEPRQVGPDGLVTFRTLMLQSSDVAPALGVSAVLRTLIEHFRTAVDDWCHVRVPAHGRRIPPRGREELEELCRTYDAAFDQMPLGTLNGLAGLAEAKPQGHPRRENLVLWSERLFGIRQKLESLAADVRHALLSTY